MYFLKQICNQFILSLTNSFETTPGGAETRDVSIQDLLNTIAEDNLITPEDNPELQTLQDAISRIHEETRDEVQEMLLDTLRRGFNVTSEASRQTLERVLLLSGFPEGILDNIPSNITESPEGYIVKFETQDIFGDGVRSTPELFIHIINDSWRGNDIQGYIDHETGEWQYFTWNTHTRDDRMEGNNRVIAPELSRDEEVLIAPEAQAELIPSLETEENALLEVLRRELELLQAQLPQAEENAAISGVDTELRRIQNRIAEIEAIIAEIEAIIEELNREHELDVTPEPEPDVTPEAEPEPDVTPEAEPEPDVTPEAEPDVTPEAEPEPDVTPEAEPEPDATLNLNNSIHLIDWTIPGISEKYADMEAPSMTEILATLRDMSSYRFNRSNAHLPETVQYVYTLQCAMSHILSNNNLGTIDGMWGGRSSGAFRELQTFLNDAGYDCGVIDGAPGPRSIGALIAYLETLS